MAVDRIPKDEGAAKARKPSAKREPERRLQRPQGEVSRILDLQRQVGNRAVQRLLAQRDGVHEEEAGAVTNAVTGAEAQPRVQREAEDGDVPTGDVVEAAQFQVLEGDFTVGDKKTTLSDALLRGILVRYPLE